MSNDRSEIENLSRRLYREHKNKLDLFTRDSSAGSFEVAVHRLFGENPGREKLVKFGGRQFVSFGPTKGAASFLPGRWHEEFNRLRKSWGGCENWWAGYPLITWIEKAPGDSHSKAYIRLHAEVGPISDHKIRGGLIRAIGKAAGKDSMKIRFDPNATDKGRLYSRFLHQNLIALDNLDSADEIEKDILHLLATFENEFELISNVIPRFFMPASN